MNYWQTELIRLRGVEPEDGDTFWRWNQDSEMARNLEFVWPPVSLSQVREWAAAEAKRKMENDSSRSLHEKLGFVREGAVRRAIFTDGRYLDELYYGMTVEEWQQRYEKAYG